MNTLYRSTTDRKLAGVAGGIGQAYNIDPTLVRIGFILLTLFSGVGLLLYGALWLGMPEPGGRSAFDRLREQVGGGTGSGNNNVLGIILVGLGALMLADMLNIVGPVMAVAFILGGWYLLRNRRNGVAN